MTFSSPLRQPNIICRQTTPIATDSAINSARPTTSRGPRPRAADLGSHGEIKDACSHQKVRQTPDLDSRCPAARGGVLMGLCSLKRRKAGAAAPASASKKVRLAKAARGVGVRAGLVRGQWLGCSRRRPPPAAHRRLWRRRPIAPCAQCSVGGAMQDTSNHSLLPCCRSKEASAMRTPSGSSLR